MAPNEDKKLVTKICPRCQEKFICNENAGCACEKIFLTKEILSYLRTKYIDCLCTRCLEYFSHSKN